MMATQARLDELRIAERVLARLAGEPEEPGAAPTPEAGVEAVDQRPPQSQSPELKPKRVVILWTEEEEDVLREHWPDAEACVPLLPGRSLSAIKYHGYMMRLHETREQQWPRHVSARLIEEHADELVDLKVNDEPPAAPSDWPVRPVPTPAIPPMLAPKETAWCAQCDQRVCGVRVDKCTDRFCKMKTAQAA